MLSYVSRSGIHRKNHSGGLNFIAFFDGAKNIENNTYKEYESSYEFTPEQVESPYILRSEKRPRSSELPYVWSLKNVTAKKLNQILNFQWKTLYIFTFTNVFFVIYTCEYILPKNFIPMFMCGEYSDGLYLIFFHIIYGCISISNINQDTSLRESVLCWFGYYVAIVVESHRQSCHFYT